MIKASSIQKLLHEIVLKKLILELEPFGFKYLKSKQEIKRSVDDFDHIISVSTSNSPLSFNEKTDELSLKFSIRTIVRAPKFDKWVNKKLNVRSAFHKNLNIINCIEIVDFDLLNEIDFFTPSESQKFKSFVSAALAGPDKEERISLSDFNNKLPSTIESFDTFSSMDTGSFETPNKRFLVFKDELDLAKNSYLKTYNNIKSKIDIDLKTNREDAKKRIQFLETYIIEAKALLGLDLENPFERRLKKLPTQQKKIRLAKLLGFDEHLRFDTSLVNIISFDLNDMGECLILTDDGVVTKIDQTGRQIKIEEFESDKHHYKHFKIKWLEPAGRFGCGNFVLSKADQFIELLCNVEGVEFQSPPQIRELSYEEKESEFHLIFSHDDGIIYHSIFDDRGALRLNKNINKNWVRTNLGRNEYILQSEGNAFDIIDFNDRLKGAYKFNNGNDRVTLSPKGDMMVFHFYSTTSQLYDLKTSKKHALWAHPTRLKGYKEKFYNDINHNFGMHYCAFTPDGRYIIGGAEHGKYVVWDTENLQRQELIPSKNSNPIFNWSRTKYTNEGAVEEYFKPHQIELEGQALFINRGYNLSKLSFINEGKYFIMQVSDCLLVWDDQFQNIGHVYGIGDATFSKSNYLALMQENEFVVFKRVAGFMDDFESSVFKHRAIRESIEIQNDIPSKPADIEAGASQQATKYLDQTKPQTEAANKSLNSLEDRLEDETLANRILSIDSFEEALVALQIASGQTFGKTKLKPLVEAIDSGEVAAVEMGGSFINLRSRDDLQSLISARDRHIKLSKLFPENETSLKGLIDELPQSRGLEEVPTEKSGFSKFLIAIVGIFLVLAALSRVVRGSKHLSTGTSEAQNSQAMPIRNVEGLTTEHKIARIVVGDPSRIDQEQFNKLKQLDDTNLEKYLSFYALLMLPEDNTNFEALLAFSPDGVQEIRNAEQLRSYRKQYFLSPRE